MPARHPQVWPEAVSPTQDRLTGLDVAGCGWISHQPALHAEGRGYLPAWLRHLGGRMGWHLFLGQDACLWVWEWATLLLGLTLGESPCAKCRGPPGLDATGMWLP